MVEPKKERKTEKGVTEKSWWFDEPIDVKQLQFTLRLVWNRPAQPNPTPPVTSYCLSVCYLNLSKDWITEEAKTFQKHSETETQVFPHQKKTVRRIRYTFFLLSCKESQLSIIVVRVKNKNACRLQAGIPCSRVNKSIIVKPLTATISSTAAAPYFIDSTEITYNINETQNRENKFTNALKPPMIRRSMETDFNTILQQTKRFQ